MDCCTSSKEKPGTDAACQVAPRGETEARCPSCQEKGRAVDHITLKALLTSNSLKRLGMNPYRFCPTTNCDVVYFAAESLFRTRDVRESVWQKSDDASVFVCYCFEHSENSIRREIDQTGRSHVLKEIKSLVQEGKCACEVRNPQGSCCLGNVSQIVTRLLAVSLTNPRTQDQTVREST